MPKRIAYVLAGAVLVLAAASCTQTHTVDQPPATPTGVTATQGAYADKIEISWDEVSRAETYYIYRSSSETGTYTSIGYVDAPSTSAVNTTESPSDYPITPGVEYWYKISAEDSSGRESSLSAAAKGYAEEPVFTVEWETDTDGYYRFATNDESNCGYAFYKVGSGIVYSGSTIKTSVRKPTGFDSAGYGMVFAYDDSDNFYVFLIDNNGWFTIQQKDAGSWTTLLDWTESSALNTGAGAENELEIDYTYDYEQYTYYAFLYINNTYTTWYIYGPNDMSGKTGFYVVVASASQEDFPDEPVDVRFDQTSPEFSP